jgi:signal transduction histidine kinase/DNA-binding NarL/FixJ family response regulator
MTPHPTTTDDAALRDLPAALDLAVFEQMPEGLFRPLGQLPAWLPISGAFPVDLAEAFPMLELFLPDFMPVWESGAPPKTSDVWTETGPGSEELYLEAVAAAVGARRFLTLRSLPKARHTYQQLAHDFELAEARAERATRAKSDFLNTMSHEIRTPLNAVIGMADVLASSPLTPEQRKCVEVSQRNGVALLTLVNDILDLAKVESGRVELESTDMDLREVIDRAMEVVEGRATAKGLALRKALDPRVPVYLIGDPNRLRQIIVNLLGNSIKFTETGHLEVRVEPDPDGDGPGWVRFAIADTGIGIAADKLHSVFESFTQADSSTTRKYGGTGLGLTISKQLVELMHGRIRVESTLGAGSTFYFTARLGVQEDQSERTTSGAAPLISNTALEAHASRLTILLADDSDDNRFLILSYLTKSSLPKKTPRVDIAENGAIAVGLFQRNRYDVVLMDVEMPVMDGYAATREIRRFESATGAPATPVLALTAHAVAEMAAKAFEAGFTELLTKPIRKGKLLEALGRYQAESVPEAPSAGERIFIEQGMEEVVPRYLDKRRAEIPIYRKALEDANFEAIRNLGHKMKGTGAGYGFPKLTDLGDALESAARRADAAEIRINTDALARYLDTVELEYSR